MKPPLILASASPRRAELLKQLEPEFQIVPSSAEEMHFDQLTACELARVNAFRKARVVAKHFPEALVLGADTLVYLDETPFGKPADLDEARGMLKALQGRTHHVVTGICLIQSASGYTKVFSDMTEVRFRALTPAAIENYLQTINPLDKAGAYAIQERGETIVADIAGSYSNVVGLPLERLAPELAEAKIRFDPTAQ